MHYGARISGIVTKNMKRNPTIHSSPPKADSPRADKFIIHSCGGFTLFELILVMGIVAIFSMVTLTYLFSHRGTTQLDLTVRQIETLLREAQSRSISQASSSAWGVHFENDAGPSPFFSLFAGSYSSTSVVAAYRLPATLGYATSTIPPGGVKEIIFSQLTGIASASTSLTIFLYTNPRASATIRVASSGVVTY